MREATDSLFEQGEIHDMKTEIRRMQVRHWEKGLRRGSHPMYSGLEWLKHEAGDEKQAGEVASSGPRAGL